MCPPDLEITLVNVAFRVACVQCAEGAATLAPVTKTGSKTLACGWSMYGQQWRV